MAKSNAERQRDYRRRRSFYAYDFFASGNDDLIIAVLDSWLENHLSGFYDSLTIGGSLEQSN